VDVKASMPGRPRARSSATSSSCSLASLSVLYDFALYGLGAKTYNAKTHWWGWMHRGAASQRCGSRSACDNGVVEKGLASTTIRHQIKQCGSGCFFITAGRL